MDGVLVVDKPEGMTSHDVVTLARRHLRERRIGHTGTLDPLATGVLPLACGRATRLVRFLSAATKDYEAVIRFGVTTDTYDVTGVPTGGTGQSPSVGAVEHALRTLEGEYLQMPPAFSAKKVGGRRAYALARHGEAIALTPAPVRVSRAALLAWHDGLGTVAIRCSAGFYVRSFADTLGQLVGTGACLQALRRTRSGAFGLDRAVTIADVQVSAAGAEALVPMEDLLTELPSVRVTEEGAHRVAHGRDVVAAHYAAGTPARDETAQGGPAEWVRLLAPDGRLIAVGQRRDAHGALHPAVVLI